MQALKNEFREENPIEQVPKSQSQELSDEKQPLMLDNQTSEIPDNKSSHIYNEQVKIQDEKLPEKQDEQQERVILDGEQPLFEKEERSEILDEELPQGQDEQQQIHANHFQEKQNEEEEEEEILEKKQPDVEKEEKSEILKGQLPQGQDEQQQIHANHVLEKQNEQQEEILEKKQPDVEKEEESEILKAQLPQRQDDQQKIHANQLPDKQNQQQHINPASLRLRPGKQQEEQQNPNEIRHIPAVSQQQQQQQQQQRTQVLERQRQVRKEEEQEKEQEIPDEVRQMPDEQQQKILQEITNKLAQFQDLLNQSQSQLQSQQPQPLSQPQRASNRDKGMVISIIMSTVMILAIGILLGSLPNYISRKEFETFKAESHTGLVEVRENSRKSLSEHEARVAKFGKDWKEYLMNMTKPNRETTPELPDYSIANLLEATRKTDGEVSKLKTEVLDLQKQNDKLQKSLESAKGKLQKLEGVIRLAEFLESRLICGLILFIAIALPTCLAYIIVKCSLRSSNRYKRW